MRLKDIKIIYNNTSDHTIKQNLRKIILDNNIKSSQLVEVLNCSIHTAYAFTKSNTNYNHRPDLLTLLIIAEEFNIDIMEFFA